MAGRALKRKTGMETRKTGLALRFCEGTALKDWQAVRARTGGPVTTTGHVPGGAGACHGG